MCFQIFDRNIVQFETSRILLCKKTQQKRMLIWQICSNKASRLVFLCSPPSLSPALLRFPELIAYQTRSWAGFSTKAQRRDFFTLCLKPDVYLTSTVGGMMKEERETGSSERIRKQGSEEKPPSLLPPPPCLAAEKTAEQLSWRVSEFLRTRT